MIEGILYHLEPDKTHRVVLPRVTERECFMKPMKVRLRNTCVMQKYMVNWPNATGRLGCEGTSSAGAVLAYSVKSWKKSWKCSQHPPKACDGW